PSTAAPTSTGARRFATEPPAYSIRSIASAFDVLDESGTACSGGRWSCCSPVECPVADVAAVVEAASVPVVPCGCDGAAASSDVVDAPSSAANESANEFRILPPTSEIIPLPNCAGRPVTLRSVATAPLVPSPSDSNVTVTVADAVPAPLASLPDASITSLRACSSFSWNSPEPLYKRLTGPSLTFTDPLNVSPSTLVNVAPGMHGATRCGSSIASHTCSTGADTVNSLSSSNAVNLRRRFLNPPT